MAPQKPPPPGSAPPTRSARAACWAARDAYFDCLDSNNLWLEGLAPATYDEVVAVDPTKIKIKSEKELSGADRNRLYSCRKMREMFEKDCLPSWVSHFSSLRVKEKQTEAMRMKVEKEEQDVQKADSDFWERVSKPQPNTTPA
ncbi:hypothetical protein HK104_005216 [Borealophlyctis nickersoniae]|nr:hypothetical protein HK104_005216 [Borealophlyctis nickersoniae]